MLLDFLEKIRDQVTLATLFLLLMFYDLISVFNDKLNLGWTLPCISGSKDLAKPVAVIYNTIYSYTFMFIALLFTIIITLIIYYFNQYSLMVGFPTYFAIIYYLFYLWLISFNICLFTGNLYLLHYDANWGAFMIPGVLIGASFIQGCYKQYEKAQQ